MALPNTSTNVPPVILLSSIPQLTIFFCLVLAPYYPIFEERFIVSILLSFMMVLGYQICRYVYKIYKCFYFIYQCVYFPYQCVYFIYQCVYFMYQCLYFFFKALYIISTCVVSICTITINLILMLSFEIKSRLSLEHSAIFLSNLADELLDPEIWKLLQLAFFFVLQVRL